MLSIPEKKNVSFYFDKEMALGWILDRANNIVLIR